ncbi:MAG: hypothetical protein ABI355_00340 [Solirubrobacteraceae bacterium]
MSAIRPQIVSSRPALATRIAAMLVVIALGCLTAFALFAAPTRVPLTGGSRPTTTTMTTTVPSNTGEPNGGEGGQ